jgi:peptide/nickel transport system permease protein
MSAGAQSPEPVALASSDAAVRLRKRAATERRWASVTLWIGVGIIAFITFVSFAAPLLGFHNPNEQHLLDALQAPSADHPMGTDTLGRDILTRVLYGGRIDLIFAVVTTIIPFALGALVGAFAGYRGGWLDTAVNRLVDTVVAFPFIVLILAIITITGPGLKGAYFGVFAVGWALYARLTRGEMLVERQKEYILAAQTLGYSTWRIVFRHALPNVLRASIVFSMADIVLNILLLSSLSYLGLGAVAPSPEWGALVADGKDVILTSWWVSTMPGLVIVLVGIGFSLIGDGIADRMGKDFTLASGEVDK